MSISAIVGIVRFSLAILPGNPYYYQVPMGIIGTVCANSMLVLINSRMRLGSEEAPSAVISAARFGTAPADDKDSALEVHREDTSVDIEEREIPSRSSEV